MAHRVKVNVALRHGTSAAGACVDVLCLEFQLLLLGSGVPSSRCMHLSPSLSPGARASCRDLCFDYVAEWCGQAAKGERLQRLQSEKMSAFARRACEQRQSLEIQGSEGGLQRRRGEPAERIERRREESRGKKESSCPKCALVSSA